MDESDLMATLAGVVPLLFLIGAVGIFVFVAEWCLLNKAGEGGWKLLIPIYGDYTKHKIAGATGIFWGKFALGVFSGLLDLMLGDFVSAENANGLGFVSLLWIICGITGIVLNIMYYLRFSKAFGQAGGFAVGLILLPVIFIPIMAFSSSIQYVGYGDARPNTSPQYAGGQSYAGAQPKTRPLTEPAQVQLPPTSPIEETLTVTVTGGSAQGSRFRVTQSGVLGRDPGSQLVLNDPYVSRTQCRFERRNGKFFVIDLGSTSGTAVEGYGKLPPNTPVELRTGDQLTVGKSTLSIDIH